MKIFISHKKEDENVAIQVKNTLSTSGVDSYLDVLDDTLCGSGEALTKHIKSKLGECTDVIVILSAVTKKSWWVPFEIGMASEKDLPIANYLLSYEPLPDYLEYWPRLKNPTDVKKYVEVRQEVSNQILNERSIGRQYYQFASGKSETDRFYAELKKKL